MTDVAFVVAGDPRRLTGGNLYDARVLRALRRAGIRVRLVRADRERIPAARLTIVDSVAFALVPRDLTGRVIALAHMDVRGRAARWLASRADRVVAVSDALASVLPRDAVVIPPGCDGVPRTPGKRRAGDGMRVLCVANASWAKGTDVIEKAARHLRMRVDHVGEPGPPSVALHSIGPLRPAALGRRYRDADVVVVPSRREGYGIVASEAIAHGRPVVASDLPSLRAIVGRAGRLVPPSDALALARALEDVKDPQTRRRLGRIARSRARTLPRWRDTERAFVSLVEAELRRARSEGGASRRRAVGPERTA